MLQLPGVTLACIDTANHTLALRALERSCAGVRFARTLFLTDAVPEGVHVPGECRGRRDRADRVARCVFALRPEGTAPLCVHGARAAGAMGRLCRQSRRVGPGVPGVRLPRRQVVLARRRHARGERGLFAALAPPAGGTAKTRASCSSRPRTRRSGARSGRCSNASMASASAAKRSPTDSRSRPRIRSASRSASMACSISGRSCRRQSWPRLVRAVLRRDRTLHAARAPAQQLRELPASGRRPSRSRGEYVAADPSRDNVRALLAQAEENAARGVGVGRNDPCPCGSGKRYKQCHGAVGGAASPLRPRHRLCTDAGCAGRARHAGTPAGRPRRRRARLSRGACDGAGAPCRVALPRRDPLPAQPLRRRAAAARTRRRARPRGAGVPQQSRTDARRRRTEPTTPSRSFDRRSRSSPI